MTANVAFFTNPNLVSSKTRGEQIAERLNAPVNVRMEPKDLPKHLVFVKTFPDDFDRIPKSVTVWYDPVDSDIGLDMIAKRPEVKVIAIGKTAYKYLKARLNNQICVVPEHHCNFDNELHTVGEGLTVGYVGYPESIDLDLQTVKEELGKLGVGFVQLMMTKDSTRQDVVKFYRDLVDVQLVFRLPRLLQGMPPEMKNPLKVANAASFGIPTVGFQELNYEEEFPIFQSCYDLEDVLNIVQRMVNHAWWCKQDELLEKASHYHINNVVSRYKELFV